MAPEFTNSLDLRVPIGGDATLYLRRATWHGAGITVLAEVFNAEGAVVEAACVSVYNLTARKKFAQAVQARIPEAAGVERELLRIGHELLDSYQEEAGERDAPGPRVIGQRRHAGV